MYKDHIQKGLHKGPLRFGLPRHRRPYEGEALVFLKLWKYSVLFFGLLVKTDKRIVKTKIMLIVYSSYKRHYIVFFIIIQSDYILDNPKFFHLAYFFAESLIFGPVLVCLYNRICDCCNFYFNSSYFASKLRFYVFIKFVKPTKLF